MKPTGDEQLSQSCCSKMMRKPDERIHFLAGGSSADNRAQKWRDLFGGEHAWSKEMKQLPIRTKSEMGELFLSLLP